MTYEALLFEQQDNIAIVTLNRPDKRNALSRQLREEISACIDAATSDESIKALVLTGAGTTFCAGFDLAEFQQGDMQEIFAHSTRYHHKVYTAAVPLVAAVNGPAMAGGMDLAAMCDVRIVSSEARFGQPQVKMGIPAAFDLLRALVPEPLARELCLTGRPMDAAEAARCGFANEVVEPGQVLARATAVAQAIAASAGSAAMKQRFRESQPKLFEPQGD